MTSSLSVSVSISTIVVLIVVVFVLVELAASISAWLAATLVTIAFSNAGDSTRLTSMSLALVTKRCVSVGSDAITSTPTDKPETKSSAARVK